MPQTQRASEAVVRVASGTGSLQKQYFEHIHTAKRIQKAVGLAYDGADLGCVSGPAR